MTDSIRLAMVRMMEDLCKLKKYHLETFYLSVSLADRYLASIAEVGLPNPCSVSLAVVCVLIAAKLE